MGKIAKGKSGLPDTINRPAGLQDDSGGGGGERGHDYDCSWRWVNLTEFDD